jgi:hypothetical protein
MESYAMMRILSALLFGASFTVLIARGEEHAPAEIAVPPGPSEEFGPARRAESKPDSGLLSSMYYPLLDRLGNMSICDVPVVLYGHSPFNLIEALRTPVFPASEKAEDRTKDTNLITLAGIGVEARKIASGGCDVVIDVTWAEKPTGAKADVADIVEAIITCLRFRLEQGIAREASIKIIGAPPNDPVWKKLEGPLWHSN